MVMKSVAGDQVREIAKNPDALFRTATKVLKNSRSSMVVECELMTEAGPRSVIAKRVNVKSFGSLLKNLVRPTQALRAWRNGQSLHDRWLPTPRPLLMLHRYRFGVPREGYLFVECVPDALGLTEALHAATGQTAVVRRWVDALARILRLMHDRGMSHGDLKAANVLIAGASRDLTTYHPVLIDLAGATAALAISTANRQRDLMRLAASCSSQVSRTDCLRFLKRYLDVPPQYGKDWKAWWRTIDRAVGRKQAKNQSRGRPVW
jgi:tRNA A-37 threonylcarbamoyl transferase component Bud32